MTRMYTRYRKTIRFVTVFVAILVFSSLLFGCAINVGNQELRVRVGTRAPQRAIENGDGQQVIIEEFDPPGSSLFLFLRGRL